MDIRVSALNLLGLKVLTPLTAMHYGLVWTGITLV